MTIPNFRHSSYSLTGHNLRAFNLIYLSPHCGKNIFIIFYNKPLLMYFPPGLHQSNWICQTCPLSIPIRLTESQITEWGMYGRHTGSVGEATSKLKGHRLQWVSLCPDTRPYVLSELHVQQCCFFISPKQLRQCCSLGPYAAAHGHPQVPPSICPWERGLDREGCLGWHPSQTSKDNFLSYSLKHDKTRALINSSQCDVASHEKVDQTGLFPAHNVRDSAGCSWGSHFDSIL